MNAQQSSLRWLVRKLGPQCLVSEFATCNTPKPKPSARYCVSPHLRVQVKCGSSMSILALLNSSDVATLVFGSLNTTSMVALSRVSRGLRAVQRMAISDSPQLLVAAALNTNALTKGQLMGWFALQGAEADMLPRTRHRRLAGGYYFLYRQPAFESVLASYLTDAKGWEDRLQLRRAAPLNQNLQCRKRRQIARASTRSRRFTAYR